MTPTHARVKTRVILESFGEFAFGGIQIRTAGITLNDRGINPPLQFGFSPTQTVLDQRRYLTGAMVCLRPFPGAASWPCARPGSICEAESDNAPPRLSYDC
jgi:hypothetical protein